MQPQVRRLGAFFSAGNLPVNPYAGAPATAVLPGLETGTSDSIGVADFRPAGPAIRAAFV